MNLKIKKIYINFLVYGSENLESGMTYIVSILDRIIPDVPRIFVVVDNSITQSIFLKVMTDRWLVSGQNSEWEFSGWDRGYKFIHEKFDLKSGDVIMYANDTFHKRAYRLGGKSYLNEFNEKIHLEHDLTQEVVGYLDDFPRPVTLMGIKYQSWIRSNIFVIPYEIADRLYPLVFPLNHDEIFTNDMKKFWTDTPKISENWKAYISSWLFGEENNAYPEYCLRWYKAQEVNSENWEFFKIKAICILSEHYLSARLQAWGISIIDINRFKKEKDRHISPYYE